MIDGAEQAQLDERVYKLASILTSSVESTLLRRGIDPSGVAEAVKAIAAVNTPVDAEDALDIVFRPRPSPPGYSTGRFGDGTQPVFYTAAEVETCVAEVSHHQKQSLSSSADPFPRYFNAIGCDYNGNTTLLVGCEIDYPDLVSPTDAGYPFCQAVARWARGEGSQALQTRSARRSEGVCMPIFERDCLTNPRSLGRYQFVNDGEDVQCVEL